MMTISDAIRIAKINGEGEARRQMGMSYVKVVPVPRTIGETADLCLKRESLGLTAEELSTVLTIESERK